MNGMGGVFISRGMTVAIPNGGAVISFSKDGKPTASLSFHVHFDVCPTWLELALSHLEDAKEKQLERIAAWKSTDEDSKAATLEREFEASMQAIMSAAIAIDAFYAVVQAKVKIPQKIVSKWQEKGTARYSQISEVLRMAFTLKPDGFKALRQNLKEIYRLRNLAIHPYGKIAAPILHPELGVGVEWRFECFRYENALLVVRESIRMLCELVSSGKPKNGAVQKYSEELLQRIQPLRDSIISSSLIK
jgi:hypothetical protein